MRGINRQITLAARPVGFPRISDFSLSYSPLRAPAAGEALVRCVYLSLDPWMRLRMNAVNGSAPPIAIGEVMAGPAVAVVVESADPGLRAGDVVEGILGWQEHALVCGREVRKVDPRGAPISTALGVLGLPGLTAYFGLLDVGEPSRGETVVVSGAAGGVGMLAGQLARIEGCRVVGVAGSEVEVSWLHTELGFDDTLVYESAADFDRQLAASCPDGIDVYFDTVGGALTDAVLGQVNFGARIVVCAQTSQYNLERPESGPRWLLALVEKRAKIEGWNVFSGSAARFPAARRKLGRWLRQGRLKYREEVAQGLESAPRAFIQMLEGKNQGKQLVRLSDPHAAAA
jgi:NADPH:quinone reductase